VAVLASLSVLGAGLLGRLFSETRLLSRHVQDDTKSVVRLVTNLFVVMTSLLLSLMLNSAKNTLETNNRNIRALATELILLDRTLRALGSETEDVRRDLVEYVQAELNEWHDNPLEDKPHLEARVEAAGTRLKAIRFSDQQKVDIWHDALALHGQVVRLGWVLADASGGTIPTPLIIMLILWLAVIFAGFGYGAPRNAITMASFFLAALLIGAALYLIVDMDTPTVGMFEPIQVSNVPLQRALAQLQR